MATVSEQAAEEVFLLSSTQGAGDVADLLVAQSVAERVPSRKPNHIFLRILVPGRTLREESDTVWWGWNLEGTLVFAGLKPCLDYDTRQPIIHGKIGGRRPTDGFVRHRVRFHCLELPVDIEGFRSGSRGPIIALLATSFFEPEVIGCFHAEIKAYADHFFDFLYIELPMLRDP